MNREGFGVVRVLAERGDRWTRRLVVVAVTLALASFVAEAFGFPGNRILERLSGLTTVRSLATWMTTILLFAIALLALLAASLDQSRRIAWGSLSIIALVLSAEEVVGLHEMSEQVATLPTDQPPSVPVLLAEIAIVALAASASVPFLRSLPPAVSIRLASAGLLVVTGAVGLQFLGAMVKIERGPSSIAHITINNLEEFSELAGIILLLSALMHHLGSLAYTSSTAVAGD